ncbi:hypothetical protein ABL78_2846 [Leptomonas seymouri]|uniref:Uncharacterized protein n=1 Tax=Leptomonas seymouri TaxID=5684 RepID=A0A0N1PCW5_LEPSE|nr:hypothetical protein ABL78_2846 [Leptomonas seymouri]|eukprot:KPI88070.1 hypothetical protein ABL78_2846 [Leptomonas seymouri]
MDSRVVQIPVRKQGAWERGNWSTRVLTVDVATATLTVSRRHHPNNVLYHSMQLDAVQMWPHFKQRNLTDSIHSIQAMMTLRLIGRVVPVPEFSSRRGLTPASVETAQSALPSETSKVPTAALGIYPSSLVSRYAFTAGNRSKEPRLLGTWFGSKEVWMIRFTAYQSYELFLELVRAMSHEKVHRAPLLGSAAEHDLDVIRTAWVKNGGASGINTEIALL